MTATTTEKRAWTERGLGLLFAGAMLTVSLLAAPAQARELVREGFDNGLVEGREGPGFSYPAAASLSTRGLSVDLPLAASPATGAFSFDLRRPAGEGALDRETVFALLNERGESLLLFQVAWNAPENEGRPVFRLRGGMFASMLGLWRPTLPVPRSVPPGAWVHVDLTWDDAAGAYNFYVDGAPLDTSHWFYDSEKKRVVRRDQREDINRVFTQRRDKPPYVPGSFATILEGAKVIRLGVNFPSTRTTASSPMTSSVLDNFVFHGDAIPIPGGGAELAVAALDHDAARTTGVADALVAGDTVTVSLGGAPGAEATFDVARLADRRGEIALSWKGWGVYLEEITFFEDDQVDLRDVEEYRVYASADPIDIGAITVDSPFVEALEVEEQGCTLDRVTVPVEGGEDYTTEFLEPDTPYYVAVMALMDDDTFRPVVVPKQGLAMTPLEGDPGTYEGVFAVDYKDVYPEAAVVGRLSRGGVSVGAVAEETFAIDARLTIEVVASEEELKADEKSTSEITVTVTDANGDAVEDHEVRFVLATTSQYTGVIGGGAFTDQVGGSLERDFQGETDMFGRVTATYTAGFAAKTAIIVARDMVSNDVGVGYVKTYINATAQLELEAVQQTAGKALGYTITVTSSDEWLTADGDSEARITAFVAQDGIPVEGHRVGFTIAAGSGRIRTVRGETDSNGKARAVYTAGTRIGIVLVRATDHTAGISGTVQIELRSDAPAKIAITVEPEVLPADGRSTADVAVVVTDINDNPSEGVEVEYAVSIGSGRLRGVDEVTDRRGESAAVYVAGTIPGRVSIEVTVRSAVPTEKELLAAGEMALTVTDHDFY